MYIGHPEVQGARQRSGTVPHRCRRIYGAGQESGRMFPLPCAAVVGASRRTDRNFDPGCRLAPYTPRQGEPPPSVVTAEGSAMPTPPDPVSHRPRSRPLVAERQRDPAPVAPDAVQHNGARPGGVDHGSSAGRARLPAVGVGIGAAALLVGSVIALLDERDAPAAAPAVAGQTVVSIEDFQFLPPDVDVAVGDTVTWTNNDEFVHTVTADDASIFDSGDLAGGAAFEFTFTEPGTIEYVCQIHPNMLATLTVGAP